MGWEEDLEILYDYYGDSGTVAAKLQVSVSADWIQRAHREEDVVPSAKIRKAITAHANGTDGTRALDVDKDESENERERLPDHHDTRLARDIRQTPRDSM